MTQILEKSAFSLLFMFLLLFNSTLAFSQKKDIYIITNSASAIDTISAENDSTKLEIFRLKLNSNFLEYEFQKDKNGDLTKKINTKTQKLKILELEYKNTNNNNPQILIFSFTRLNHISFNDMMLEKNLKNLVNIIKSFNNIYLINNDNKCNGYYVAKKVVVKPDKADL